MDILNIFLTIGGFVIALWQVYEFIQRRFLEKMRVAFLDICTRPQSELIQLDQLYKSIIDYYRKEIEEIESYTLIDWNYINHCCGQIPNIELDKPKNLYAFPLVTKNVYLLSKNPKLHIRYRSFSFDHFEEKNTLDGASKKFLGKLNIENLSSFISERKRIWDQSTFDLYNFEYYLDTLSLDFMRGSYFKYVNRNELLSRESFFQYQIKNDNIDGSRLLKEHFLPKENAARSVAYGDDFFDFSNRATTIGFHIFVLMHKGEGKFCTFVQKRGITQVEYPEFYHVVPAGTFQPLAEFDEEVVKRQCNFAFTVLREFLEEVFDMEEIDRDYRSTDPFRIFIMETRKGFSPGKFLVENVDIKELPMESKNYKIIPTGFYVDLMTLKPQLSFVFIIKNEALYKQAIKHFRGNWEGEIQEYDLDDQDFIRFLQRNLHVKRVPPAGAVAFGEGIHYYYNNRSRLLTV
jgi:hypothetical protein